MPDKPVGEPLFDRRPKRLINRVQQFIRNENLGPFPEYQLGIGSLSAPLPEDYAFRAEVWAHEVHRSAARGILQHPEIFPRGSIGFAWARKILDPGLVVVKTSKGASG